MKLKFLAITFLLLFARGCDFYSTQLWFFEPGGMAGETNPLTRYLGVGWTGLIIVNVIVVSLILISYYYYLVHYRSPVMNPRPAKFLDFASQLYFKEDGKLYKLFYTLPLDKKMMAAHYGYMLTWIVIIGSFMATIHNLCQFYQVPIYDSYREIVGRPLYVIYGLLALTYLWFQYRVLKIEYNKMKGLPNYPS
jgi:hypothetical protein